MRASALPRPALVTLTAGAVILAVMVALAPAAAGALGVLGVLAVTLLRPLPAGTTRPPVAAILPTSRSVIALLVGAVLLGALTTVSPAGAMALVLVAAVAVAVFLRIPAGTGQGLAINRPLGRRGTAALLAGAVVLGVVTAWQPAAGLGLALIGLLTTAVLRTPLPRLGVIGIMAAAVAGILGPNLALPQAPQVFGFRVIIVLMGIGFTAYLIVDGRLPIPAAVRRPAGFLLAMNIWSIISISWAHDTTGAIRWTFFLLMMSGLAIGLALACQRRENAIRLVIVLGITFLLATLAGLLEIRFGFRLPTSQLLGKSSDAATSLFGNQNNFATYLTLSLPFFLCLPVVFRDARLIVIGTLGSVLTLACLMFTGSRSNLLATGLIVVGLVAFLLVYGRGATRFLGFAVAGVVAVLVVPSLSGNGILPIPQDAVTKFDVNLLLQQRKEEIGSGAVRSAVLGQGLEQVRASGGLGIGAGNAESRLLTLDNFTGVDNLHNWWLELLVDLGIPGFLMFIGMYVTLLRRQVRAAHTATDPLVRWLALSGALALIGFLVGAMGPSSVIHFAPMWITFGLGMLTLILARADRDANP